MKILHICQYYNDGWGYQENLLPKYQAKLGHEVVIVTSDREFKYSAIKRKIVGRGVYFDKDVKIIRLPIKFELINRFVVFNNIFKVLIKEKPDYIFHHGISMPSLFTVIRYKQKFPNTILVADSHSDLWNSGKKKYSLKIYHGFILKVLLKYFVKFIDKIFCVTPWTMEFEEKIHKIPKEKLSLLLLGVDAEQSYYNELGREEIRKLYNIKKNDFVIISAGKIDKHKRIEILIKAVKEIKDEKVKVFIVGSISVKYLDQLKSIIGNDPRFIFTGWIKREMLNKYFSASDIGVWPGTQSAIWQEAISCGLPILVKYWPKGDYIVKIGNGNLLYSENPNELKQYIKILKECPSLLNKMRKAAYKFSRDTISYKIIAEKSIEEILEKENDK